MSFNFDTSKLSQAAARKSTLHDNCIVLDLGTGSFPRDIEVRLPDDDGARQIAIWDGSLDLAINDEVLCDEYAGNPKWRVAGMGGADSGAGKQRVSKVWESDFGAVAMETDANGNVTINGARTLTIPTDLIHAGDPDTMLSFTDDAVEITVGSLSMLKLTETTQDLVEIGDVGGGGDIDIDFNSGQMFLRGSDGILGLGTASPIVGPSAATFGLHIKSATDNVGIFVDAAATKAAIYYMGISGTPIWHFANSTAGEYIIAETGVSTRLAVSPGGNVAIDTIGTSLARLLVNQPSTTAAIPVVLLDQADLSEEFVNFISTIGAGNPIDTAAIGTFYGKIRVAVNGTFKYIALYNS